VPPPRRSIDPELLLQANRDLVGLCGRLVRERSFEALADVVSAAADEDTLSVTLATLDNAVRSVERTLAALPAAKNPHSAIGDDVRMWRLTAAETLVARINHPPVGPLERGVLERAAGLFARAGNHRRAALAYQELGDDSRAAEAWGAIGDLDQMEAALARDEGKISARRSGVAAAREFESLMAAGDRRAALAIVAAVSGVEDAAAAHEAATRIEARLVRGRGVTLRLHGGPWVRIAALPAVLGRDPAAEIPLRDAGVSRRHALLRATDTAITIEDAGSRGGVRLGGARIESPIPLAGEGELAIGPGSALRFFASERTVRFEGSRGLDRAMRAIAGIDPIPLELVAPELEGLSMAWPDGGARLLRRRETVARVSGQLIGPGLDLLHGDVVEIGAGLRLEVE
jgi:hypothetical protein